MLFRSLNELTKKLADVIKYDSPEEIVGSLYLAGKANHHLGDTFINAPVPHGLKAEELKQYGIADKIF